MLAHKNSKNSVDLNMLFRLNLTSLVCSVDVRGLSIFNVRNVCSNCLWVFIWRLIAAHLLTNCFEE